MRAAILTLSPAGQWSALRSYEVSIIPWWAACVNCCFLEMRILSFTFNDSSKHFLCNHHKILSLQQNCQYDKCRFLKLQKFFFVNSAHISMPMCDPVLNALKVRFWIWYLSWYCQTRIEWVPYDLISQNLGYSKILSKSLNTFYIFIYCRLNF